MCEGKSFHMYAPKQQLKAIYFCILILTRKNVFRLFEYEVEYATIFEIMTHK